ncbi:MAG: hypothetical protein RLZZ450_7656 [Pseudomonadota bacterium]|jgi:hypothetical protein
MTTTSHIVLVPGFGGFDALGQLEYYTGTTEQFYEWRHPEQRAQAEDRPHAAPLEARQGATLHYFANSPTAGVATRAALLKQFLAKKLARNEIQEGDRVALVGHSTGGLDIRQLLLSLDREAAPSKVDGSQKTQRSVPGQRLLDHIDRVVFMSVPQRGTNIADWFDHYELPTHLAIRVARSIIKNEHLPSDTPPVLLPIVRLLASAVRKATGPISDVSHAVLDVQREIEIKDDDSALSKEYARQARSDVGLFFDDIDGDFLAIKDLAARAESHDPPRLVDAGFEMERALWTREGIETLSFATVAKCPFDTARMKDSRKIASLLRVVRAILHRSQTTDPIFRLVYALCAEGPFLDKFSTLPAPLSAIELATGSPRSVHAWDNDGIANTASMLWPGGKNTLLVDGDHGDIIGHFELQKAPAPSEPGLRQGRVYSSYDFFASDSSFAQKDFAAVWQRVFDFCVS